MKFRIATALIFFLVTSAIVAAETPPTPVQPITANKIEGPVTGALPDAVVVSVSSYSSKTPGLSNNSNGKDPQKELIAAKARKLNLRKLDVCATTGDISKEGCPALASTWFIPGVSPIHKHDVYRPILVNVATGKRACQFKAGVTEYRTFEVWPSDLRQTLTKAGIHKQALPPRDENCDTAYVVANGQAPVITSPQASVEYHASLQNSRGYST